jgi:Zn-dependent protease with chaperone function
VITSAEYFDGKVALAQEATLQLFGPMVQVTLSDRTFAVNAETSRVLPPMGSGDWSIEMPDGGQLRFTDADFGKELCQQFGESLLVDRMERSWRWAVIALVVAVFGTWAVLTFGVPVAARHVAFLVPSELNQKLGSESIGLLDRMMFDDSELPPETIDHVQELFEAIKSENPEFAYFRIEFRASPAIGANAFAIPGGLVVITDGMVNIAESDAELISVLAHEVGHLAQRHGLRILLQNSASALIIASLTGDLSNITALSASIPTILMQAKYSRNFEREADDFAFDYLESHDLDSHALSELLMRIDASDQSRAAAGEVDSWLSSHPRSSERTRE